jgi:hypothetical protein
MLSEYKEVRQRDSEGYRRWFSDQYFDVIIWYDREGGSMTGFQVCYDKGGSERAFTRKLERKIVQSHRFVANGPVEIGTSKMTSILKGDAKAIDETVVARLRSSAGDLDEETLAHLIERMEEYNRGRSVVDADQAR